VNGTFILHPDHTWEGANLADISINATPAESVQDPLFNKGQTKEIEKGIFITFADVFWNQMMELNKPEGQFTDDLTLIIEIIINNKSGKVFEYHDVESQYPFPSPTMSNMAIVSNLGSQYEIRHKYDKIPMIGLVDAINSGPWKIFPGAISKMDIPFHCYPTLLGDSFKLYFSWADSDSLYEIHFTRAMISKRLFPKEMK
jgi:hypothetical protein